MELYNYMTSNNKQLREIGYGTSRRQSLGQMIKSIYNEIPATGSASEGRPSKYPRKLMVCSTRSIRYNCTQSF